MKNKRIMSAAMAVLMAGSLAACGGSASSTADSTAAESTSTAASTEATAESTDEPVTIRITWWGGQTRHDLTQQVLDLYTSEHPNVTFEAVPSGWDGYFEKLATDTATGGMPDIVQMDYMYISTYAQNGSLADLSEYINNGTIDASGIDEALMNASNIGVQLMTIEAAVTRDRKKIYQAAMLDPHTAAELNIHDIISMCDELIAAHGDYMKDYK